jgi:hypothetical protein
MTLKPKDPMMGSRSGAFMGEGPWQSQPTPTANAGSPGHQIAIIRNP